MTALAASSAAGGAPHGSRSARPATSARRGDVQGLRAVAVLAVMAYHAGVPGVGGGFGGVDVFFVISGFLITGLVVREVERTGRLDLLGFWARRARRLLPATAVVLVGVAALCLLLLPVTRWPSVAVDLLTSALYVVNWRLAEQSVDYLASQDAASPLQHFWSLAVEEQFYVVWPLLVVALVPLCRRWGTRAVLGGAVLVLGAASFAWSVHLVGADPGRAYFVTTTRAWELALGAGLALAGARLERGGRRTAAVLGAAGLVAVVAAVTLFDEGTPFPGVAALLPTLGVAALLVAGGLDRRGAVPTLLSWAPLQRVGDLSYSLYLWHWPVVVVATARWGGPDHTLPVAAGVAAVLVSVVPAWLSYRLVEEPLHHSRRVIATRPRALALVAVCTALGVGAAATVQAQVPPPASAEALGSAPGAAVLGDDPGSDPDGRAVDEVARMVPDPVTAADDKGGIGGKVCIDGYDGSELETCTYGSPQAQTSVAVVGDSKMHQWLPAIEEVADARGWRVVTMLKDACPLTRLPARHRDRTVYEECAAVNDQRYEQLSTQDFDVVITSQLRQEAFLPELTEVDRRERTIEEMVETWQGLEDGGTDVVVVLDNPRPPQDVLECAGLNPDRLTRCAFSRSDGEAASAAPTQLEALERAVGVESVDVTDRVCPADTCPAVIGEVLVYRKGSHLTATYVATLAASFDEAVLGALGADS